MVIISLPSPPSSEGKHPRAKVKSELQDHLCHDRKRVEPDPAAPLDLSELDSNGRNNVS